jgi:hypothetical protein
MAAPPVYSEDMPRACLLAAAIVAALLSATASAQAATTWLCGPGAARDACAGSLTTAVERPDGTPLRTETPKRSARRIDCFYVYPTVSGQPRDIATKRIDPQLRTAARVQAARYGQHCRVFAPVYRQRTIQGLGSLLSGRITGDIVPKQGYADVRAAWREYLRRWNRGRGVVFIGHSQGTFVLRRLLEEEIDPKPAERRRLVSAVLMGGNVLVRAGSDRGGDFRNIRACRSARQLGCVVAFSLYGEPPPADAIFARAFAPYQVLCTNPANLAGGTGLLDPIRPASTPSGWVSAPRSYRAQCVTGGGATSLQVTAVNGAPVLTAPSPAWGLHTSDGTLPLGNLVDLVGRQARAYASRSRSATS